MQITNEYNLPTPFLDATKSDYEYKEKRYSVTSLLNEPRFELLKRRHYHELTSDVSDRIWLIFGTAVHKILEESKEEENQIKEGKLTYTTPNGYTLSGQFDLYDALKKCVTDYKTASVNKVIFNDWEDYRKQCLYYCCLANANGFECNSGEIVALLKDHSKSKAKIAKLKGDNYPQKPVHIVKFIFSDDDIKKGFEEINKWFKEIEELEQIKDNDLPDCSVKFKTFNSKLTYAVMKKGRKTSLKNCNSEQEAMQYMVQNNYNTDPNYYIETRIPEPKRCMDYCDACEYCNKFKEMRSE